MKNNKIKLIHNPFTITTTLSVNDNVINETWFNDIVKRNDIDQRFSNIVEELTSGLMKRFKPFDISFSGIQADFDSLESELNKIDDSVILQKDNIVDGNQIYRRIEDLLVDITSKDSKIKKYEGINDSISPQLDRISNRRLVVSVMAPMKNGKSTFINSIIGKDLLPAKSERCTAKITTVDYKEKNGFQAKAHGKDKSGEFVPATKEILKNWNDNEQILHVELKGKFASLDIGEDYNLCVVDTPGPDSAIHLEDKLVIDRYLSDETLPMVCFVIERLNEETKKYLQEIRKKLDSESKQAEDRVFFVVSKIDNIKNDMINEEDSNKDDNPLKRRLIDIKNGLIEIGFKAPKLFPVSSNIALTIRKSNYDALKKIQQRDLQDFAEVFYENLDNTCIHEYSDISKSTKKLLSDKLEKAKEVDDKQTIYSILSGVVAVEEYIKEYLSKYLIPARIYDAYFTLKNHIESLNLNASLLNDISKESEKLQETNDALKSLEKKLTYNKDLQCAKEKTKRSKFDFSSDIKSKISNSTYEIYRVYDKYPWKESTSGNVIIDDIDKQIREVYKNIMSDCIWIIEKKLNLEKKTIIDKYIDIIKALECSDIERRLKQILVRVTGIALKVEKYKVPKNLLRQSTSIWDKIKKTLGFKDRPIIKLSELKESLRIYVDEIGITFNEDIHTSASSAYEDMKSNILKQLDVIDSKIKEFLKEQENLVKDKRLCEERKNNLEAQLKIVQQVEDKMLKILEIN